MKSAIVIGSGFGGLALAIRLQSAGVADDHRRGARQARRARLSLAPRRPCVRRRPDRHHRPRLPPAAVEIVGRRHGATMSTWSRSSRSTRSTGPTGRASTTAMTTSNCSRRSPRSTPPTSRATSASSLTPPGCSRKAIVKLGTKAFESIGDMLKAAPALAKYQAWRSVYSIVSKFVADEHLRQALSFHTLLVGGNPMTCSSIYALIHKLERDGGVWFAKGGTNRLVAGMVALFERLGGELRLDDPAVAIEVEDGVAKAVRTRSGWRGEADAVASNGDVVASYGLIEGDARGPETGQGAQAQELFAVAVRAPLRARGDLPRHRPPHDPVRPALRGIARRHLRSRHARERPRALPPPPDRDRPVDGAAGLLDLLRARPRPAPRPRAGRLERGGRALCRGHPRHARRAADPRHPQPHPHPLPLCPERLPVRPVRASRLGVQPRARAVAVGVAAHPQPRRQDPQPLFRRRGHASRRGHPRRGRVGRSHRRADAAHERGARSGWSRRRSGRSPRGRKASASPARSSTCRRASAAGCSTPGAAPATTSPTARRSATTRSASTIPPSASPSSARRPTPRSPGEPTGLVPFDASPLVAAETAHPRRPAPRPPRRLRARRRRLDPGDRGRSAVLLLPGRGRGRGDDGACHGGRPGRPRHARPRLATSASPSSSPTSRATSSTMRGSGAATFPPTGWPRASTRSTPRSATGLVEIAERLAALANRYRASSKVGAARLPFRSRWAVLSAAAIYGEVATRAVEARPARLGPAHQHFEGGKIRAGGRRLRRSPAPRAKVSRAGLWTRPAGA